MSFVIHIDSNGCCTTCGSVSTTVAPCKCVTQQSGYDSGGPASECKEKVPAKCVLWSGSRIPLLDVDPNERLTSVIGKIVTKLADLENRIIQLEQ
jgi:hypothetical protein